MSNYHATEVANSIRPTFVEWKRPEFTVLSDISENLQKLTLRTFCDPKARQYLRERGQGQQQGRMGPGGLGRRDHWIKACDNRCGLNYHESW
jgi:hypothetical protein